MNVVAINGSTSKPSRTGEVVAILADAVSRRPVAQPDGKPVRPLGQVQKDNRDLVHP